MESRAETPEPAEHQPGRAADRPRGLGRAGWMATLSRVRQQVKQDNLSVIAAGVAFFAFLAVFPALAALVSIYGLISDPQQVQAQIASLGAVLPEEVIGIFEGQLSRVAASSPSALGWGVALSLLFTLWAANKGTRGLIKALNVAYHEQEKRGFFRLNGLTLLLTLAGIIAAVLAIALVVATPAVLAFLGLGAGARVAAEVVRFVILIALVVSALAVLYRYGASRDSPRWRWVTPGSILAAVLWLAGSIAFSIYIANFGGYHETYGSLGAIAILLLWFFLSAYVILLGAELNAEAEHQTARDTTVGRPEPMGRREAQVADTLGPSPA